MSPILVSIYLYCLSCIKFDQLILGITIKIVAVSCFTLRPKCTKSISAGALPQTLLGELTALLQSIAGFHIIYLVKQVQRH